MTSYGTLCDMKPGDKAFVISLENRGSMRRRLLDIGFTEDTSVECVGISPGKGLCAYLVRGAVIALRPEDTRQIIMRREYGTDKQVCRQESVCRE